MSPSPEPGAWEHRLAPFNEWAPPDPSVDFPFWYKLAYSADEPILEVGCGFGRITIPLGEYGIRTIGLDTSAAALAEARRRASPDLPVTFVEGDIRSVDLGQKLGLVIFPANTFLQLLTADDQRAALLNVRRHLRLGGRLALALFVPDLATLGQSVGHQAGAVRFLGHLPGSDDTPPAAVYEHRRTLPFEQVIERHLLIETLAPDGGTIARHHHDSRLAYLWPRELRYLLEVAGFRIEALYGGFRQDPFGPASRQQVWVARKVPDDFE